MAFFAKLRRKLKTKNFKANFHRKLRTLEKCSNIKKLRTAEPQPILTGSYKSVWRHTRYTHSLLKFFVFFIYIFISYINININTTMQF